MYILVTECELLEDYKENETKILEEYKSTVEMMQEKNKKFDNKIAIMYDKFEEYKKQSVIFFVNKNFNYKSYILLQQRILIFE